MNAANDTIITTTFVCGGPLAAGTYTVGGASPDFQSLEEVQSKLVYCGITGAVVFDIRPGTYYTQFEFAIYCRFKFSKNNHF